MAFRRSVLPRSASGTEALTAALSGIGMNFDAEPDWQTNIEDALLFASEAGMEQGGLRTLSVLLTWIDMHGQWINADRLTRIVLLHESERLRAFWSGVGHWQARDRRFARLQKAYAGPRVSLFPVGGEFQIRHHGEDPRFAEGPLRVPATVLRDHRSDVMEPTELCRHHRSYRNRVLLGPSYRADMLATLASEPDLSAAALARQTYGSFATAWQVRRDFAILNP